MMRSKAAISRVPERPSASRRTPGRAKATPRRAGADPRAAGARNPPLPMPGDHRPIIRTNSRD